MSNEKKPREFWVAPHLCYEECPTMGSGYEHVIEYSAYEKLRARIIEVNGFLHDANKERGEWIAGSNLLEEMVRNQTKCTDELKAKLVLATETVKHYACHRCQGDTRFPCYEYIACDALKELGAEK